MIRLLSYIYPITKKVKSVYNGTLEITWYQGKKLLNSKNTNYSYGSLAKILYFGIKKTDLSNCKSVLVLGLGGGSVIKLLQNKFNYKHQIIALDFDKEIIKIAKTAFNIYENEQLKIVCKDALSYLKETNLKYHFIIVDLFIDDVYQNKFYRLNFGK